MEPLFIKHLSVSIDPRTLMMETSVKAAKVLAPPQPEAASSSLDDDSTEVEAVFNPMEEFNRRLEDIISTHGSAAGLQDKQVGQVMDSHVISTFKFTSNFC